MYNFIKTPFTKYSLTLITRLPYSKFYFRPLFLNEIYIAFGVWESFINNIFTPNKGDVVLDVGAHIGYYSLKAAKAVGTEGIVISVEPDPRNFKILEKNININNLKKNVKLINCALSSHSGYAKFHLNKDPAYSELINKSQLSYGYYKKIKIKTMDELCEQMGIRKLDWVKIDVEGGAADVLKGGLKILRNPTEMIIEVPDNETLELLSKLEYSIMPLYLSNSKFGYYYANNYE